MVGLLAPVGLAALGALTTGGSVNRLARIRFDWWWLIVGCFVLELALYNPPVDRQAWALALGPWFWVGTKFAMMLALARNVRGELRRDWPLLLMLCGLALNTLAIVTNSGHMPQSVSAAAAVWGPEHAGPDAFPGRLQNIAVMDAATRLAWLCDVLPEPTWIPRPNVLSVGDVLLSAGMAAWMFTALHSRKTA